ncbi:Integrase catalytic region [Haloterrigena salina JCM 13891]|uniref:Integrase catalytic region n=1 Tax=Haloterrigena salina JCM 13891 TaxID=1227488 RepID=M0CQ91_9EURY|nr:Integrase catalytic region [Haloterrigena salina JCM 13891]
MYAAIDIDTKLILDVALFERRGTDPAAAFLHGRTKKHDLYHGERGHFCDNI